VLKLAWWKLRIEAARYRASPITLAVPVLVCVLAGMTFWAARVVFGALVPVAPAFADMLLFVLFASSGMFLTVAALRWGVQRLFLSSDLELMMTLPIGGRNVLAIKALEIVMSSPTSALLLLATTWGYLRAHDQPFAIGVACATVIPVVLGAALPGVLLTLLLVRVLSRSQVRGLLAVLPAVIGAAFVFMSPVVGGFGRIVEGRFDAQQLESVAASAVPALRLVPTSWAADFAIGVASGEPSLALRGAASVLIAISVLVAITYVAFRALFRTAWTQMAEASTRVRRGTLLERMAPPFPGPIRAIVLKEWRTFFRDMRTIATTFFPALIFGYLVVSNAREGDGTGLVFPVFFLTLVVPSIASTALLNERRNITLFKAAPTTGFHTLLGKLAAYGVPLAVVIFIFAATFGVISGRRFVEVILLAAFAVWTLGWVMLTHLAIAGLWARFDAEKPTLPLVPSIAGMLATTSMGATQILFGLWVAGRTGADVGVLSHPLLGVPFAAVAAAWCAGATFAALAAGRRLDRIDAP
jgi:hypothetical protein